MDLFGDLSGEELRDLGMAAVLDHQSDSWKGRAYAFALGFMQGVRSFTGEEIRLAWERAGGDAPKHHNAWGALINVLAQAKKIRPTGEVRRMEAPRSHARRSLVWEKV